LAWQNEWNTHSWTIVGNALKLLQLILGHFKDSETASAIETIEQSIYQRFAFFKAHFTFY
jgi:hypothetical protein